MKPILQLVFLVTVATATAVIQKQAREKHEDASITIDESGWDMEPIPAAQDPEIVRLWHFTMHPRDGITSTSTDPDRQT